MSFVRLPRLGLLAIYSIYLMPGQSLQAIEVNIKVITALVGHIASHSLEWVVAGDWNLDTHVVAGMPWVERSGAAVMAPDEPTCITPEAATIRDFMVVSARLASTQRGATVITDFSCGHSPPGGVVRARQALLARCADPR